MAKYCIAKNGPALYLDCRECREKECESFFCLVAGSRGFTDYPLLEEKLDHYLVNFPRIIIVSGGSTGS